MPRLLLLHRVEAQCTNRRSYPRAVAGVKTADGVELNTKSVRSLASKPIDTLVVLGAFVVDDVARDRALSSGLRRTLLHADACVLCVFGSFLLAAAGILNPHRAATHWMHTPLLARRYPRTAAFKAAVVV